MYINFFESRESGVPDSYTTLHIPDTGKLPAVPFRWDGKTASAPTVIESQPNRPSHNIEPEGVFPAIMAGIRGEAKQDILASHGPDYVYLVWVEERKEWVAFQASHTYGRTDNYGFSDDYVYLSGPWEIDESHCRALISGYLAYALTDLTKVPFTPPSVLETERAKYILGQLEVRQYPRSDAGPGLVEIAKSFGRGGIKPTSILLDGYLKDGERYGGYPYHEEQRNKDGQGVLLYSYRIQEMPLVEDSRAKHTRIVELQIWRLWPEYPPIFLLLESSKIRFLVFQETFDNGYLGIDNFPGYEERWVVLQDITLDNPE